MNKITFINKPLQAFKKITSILFIYKRIPIKIRFVLVSFSALLIALAFPFIYSNLTKPQKAAAGWFDDGWKFRVAITINNGGSTVYGQKVKLDLDTASLITASKLQGDCDDSRFTDAGGNNLRYYIDGAVGACNSASTDYYILMPVIYAGENIVYHYYGAPIATIGGENLQFAETTFSPASTSNASEESSPEPALYLKFNEASGQYVYDSSYNGSDGWRGSSVSAASTDPTLQGPEYCIEGYCLRYDGSNDRVYIPNTTSIDFNDGGLATAWTISAWFSADSDGENDNGQLFWKISDNFNIRTTGQSGNTMNLQAIVDLTTTNATLTLSQAVNVGQWYHVSMVWTNDADDEIDIYLNGVYAGSSTDGDGDMADDTSDLRVGSRDDGNQSFDGQIDEFKIYNYSRTAQQILNDFVSLGTHHGASVTLGSNELNTPSLSDDLVGYWKFDDSDGETTDISGFGHTLTEVNGVAQVAGRFADAADLERGSSELYYRADSTALSITGSFTLSAWIRPEDTTAATQYDIMGKWDQANESYLFQRYGDELRCFVDSGNDYVTTNSTNLVTAQYYHVACVYDAALRQVFIYVDGVSQDLTTTGTIPASIGDDAGRFHIGGEDSTGTDSNFHDGYIDDARVYKRAFARSEVADLSEWVTGPNGFWTFEQNDDPNTTNATLDVSSYNNIGARNGGATITDGKIGKSLLLDGSSGYVSVSDANSLDTEVFDFTIEAWIKPTDIATGERVILGKHDSNSTSSTGYAVLQSGDDIYIEVRNTGTETAGNVITDSIVPGVWQHIAVVFNRTGSAVGYLNGVQKQSVTISGENGSYSNSTSIGIGRNPSGANRYFYGALDNVTLYDSARTQRGIIKDMMNQHSSVGAAQPSAVGYWKFDEGTGTVANNSGYDENALNGAITGAAWTTAGKYDKGLNFDGAGDLVTVTNVSTGDIDLNNNLAPGFSISAWFNADSDGEADQGTIWSKGASTYLRVESQSGSNLSLRANVDLASGDGTVTLSNITTTGTWTHVVVTYTDDADDEINVYVDGKLLGTSTGGSGAPATESNNFLIGTNSTSANDFDGKIDDVKIYNHELRFGGVTRDFNRNAGFVFGAASTDTSGLPEYSMDRAFCPPGDTTASCSPVGYWQLEEISSSRYDQSGNNNTLTNSGLTVFGMGVYGKGADFERDNSQYLSIIDGSQTNLQLSNNLTVDAWIRLESYGSSSTARSNIVRKGNSATSNMSYSFEVGGSNSGNSFLSAQISTSGTAYTSTHTSTTPLNLNTWYHVGWTYNGTTSILYLNGNRISSQAMSGTPNNDSQPFYIGINYDDYFDGIIDDVRVYNFARSPGQFAIDYSRGKPVAHYRFDECQSDVIYDSSDNALDGTVSIGAGGTQTTGTGYGSCYTSATTPRYTGRSGKFNSALNFDGTDDVVTISNNSKIDLNENLSDGHSFSAWFYANSDGEADQGQIFWKGNNTYIRVSGQSGSVLTVDASLDLATSDATASFTGATNTGSWNHVVVTYTDDGDDEISIYINGKLRTASTNGSGSPAAESNSLLIGGTTSNNFDGVIDEPQIFNYELTAQQVQTLYTGGAVRIGPSTGIPEY